MGFQGLWERIAGRNSLKTGIWLRDRDLATVAPGDGREMVAPGDLGVPPRQIAGTDKDGLPAEAAGNHSARAGTIAAYFRGAMKNHLWSR